MDPEVLLAFDCYIHVEEIKSLNKLKPIFEMVPYARVRL